MKATLHWVSAAHARATPRCGSTTGCSASRTPTARSAKTGEDITDFLNPDSLEVLRGCKVEPMPRVGRARRHGIQFERLGYFAVDPDSTPGAPVFNRTVSLKDTWAKVAARAQ